MIKISDSSIVFFRDSFKRQLSTLASLTPTVELIRPSNQDHKKTTLSISISFLWSHPQRLSVFMIMLKSLPTSQTHDWSSNMFSLSSQEPLQVVASLESKSSVRFPRESRSKLHQPMTTMMLWRSTQHSTMSPWIPCSHRRSSDITNCCWSWLRCWKMSKKHWEEKSSWVKSLTRWLLHYSITKCQIFSQALVSFHLSHFLPGLLIWTRELSSFQNGSQTPTHQLTGFLDSSSLRLSSQVLDRTSQESISSLLMSLTWTSRSTMRSIHKRLPRSQRMVFSASVCTSKVPDGTRLSIWLMSLSQSSCTLSCHWFGMFQRETERSQHLVSMTAQCTRYSPELVLFQPLVIQPTSSSTSSCQLRKIQPSGSEEVSPLSLLLDIDWFR